MHVSNNSQIPFSDSVWVVEGDVSREMSVVLLSYPFRWAVDTQVSCNITLCDFLVSLTYFMRTYPCPQGTLRINRKAFPRKENGYWGVTKRDKVR
jgi:hypothetical protein